MSDPTTAMGIAWEPARGPVKSVSQARCAFGNLADCARIQKAVGSKDNKRRVNAGLEFSLSRSRELYARGS